MLIKSATAGGNGGGSTR